jgi:integrase
MEHRTMRMGKTKQDRLDTEIKRIEESDEIQEEEQTHILQLIRAYNEEDLTVSKPSGESYRTVATLSAWLERLTTSAKRIDSPIHQAEAKEINQAMMDMHTQDELSKTTVRNYQYAVRRFIRFHELEHIEPEDVSAYEPDGKGIDPADILTREEIEELKQVVDSSRDNAILHLLLYTGMRNTALRTLRWKDIELDEGSSGRYRINPDAEGTKGAGSEYRPLLGATGALRDWKQYHPDPSPDNYVISQKPGYRGKIDPTEPVTSETIRYTTHKIMDDAGIDKPAKPHFFRHNFVSICRRDYDMDDDTIKWLIHHSDSSDVMRTTYKHLSSEDWIQKAEVSAGYAEEEEESSLTPMACDVCGHSLGPTDVACSNCGNVFSPDAHSTKEEIEEDMYQAKGELEEDEEDALDKMKELIEENPEMLSKLMED